MEHSARHFSAPCLRRKPWLWCRKGTTHERACHAAGAIGKS
jgi:hypothetical protein